MYLITNRHLCSRERYFEVIKEAVNCGVENIIIREKDLSDKDLENLCLEIRDIFDKLFFKCKEVKANFIINSNTSLYEKLDFDGIHLPFSLFSDLIEREYHFKRSKILGLSLHSVDEVRKLNDIVNKTGIKVNYITLSHIYETNCKIGLEAKGLNLLKDSRKLTDIKIVALGGILPSNVSEVLRYSDDFAVMSTIMESENIRKTISDYKV
ncbi:thiamine phosphate synthase [Metaclostridioides mangenotii]|uniref:Thiamine-phosphate pyrophosphorylase n=1 Tax=Metaclostridioides mangenotii TaxID=1540 RepID=A0ABS4ECL7_9FIRM|nr:thiamine phosphate synthase [Clostridioides mangenotii]MBP1855697.1 thiamine-phosphate pyrophosphorylase [Clostridioides mangenotii]